MRHGRAHGTAQQAKIRLYSLIHHLMGELASEHGVPNLAAAGQLLQDVYFEGACGPHKEGLQRDHTVPRQILY